MMKSRLRILHVITGLETGGAERTLLRLLEGGLRDQFDCTVLSLSGEGTYGALLRQADIPVHCLHMKSSFLSPAKLLEFRRLLKQLKPDVVQGWMYHGNLMASLSRVLSGTRPAVAWNVRHALYDIRDEKPNTRLVIRACRYLSGHTEGIIYNSAVARRQHESFGYSAHQAVVIPNGVDLEQSRPDPETRMRIRKELDIPIDALVLGHIARYHPIKDHVTFLKAMVPVMDRLSSLYVVMVGKGIDGNNPDFSGYLDLVPANHIRLLGERPDVEQLMTAMDVMCQSSISEAFPNVLCEAMATAVPCVATGVGNSDDIVGDTGLIVPPRDMEALGNAIEHIVLLTTQERKAMGRAARARIGDRFGLDSSIKRYVTFYEALIDDHEKGTH